MAGGRSDRFSEWNRGLYENYKEALVRFFRRKAPESEAEDLAQDVLVRLVDRPPTTTAQPENAYVFTVAMNLLRDQTRKARVRSRVYGPADLRHSNDDFAVASEEPNAERVLLSRSELDRVAKALGELTERTRSIFILCRVEGMPHRDVAAQLGISVSAVEKHVSKAITHLADRLQT